MTDNLDLWAVLPMIVLAALILSLALVIAFFRRLSISCAVAVLGLAVTFATIIWLARQTGGPWQVTPLLIVDSYSLLFSGIAILASLLIALMSYSYQASRGDHQDEFYLLLLLATLGGMTLAMSAHFASLILGLELLGVSLYAMISFPSRGLFSLEAGLKYLILSGVSSALILFGIALLYGAFGSLAFGDLNFQQIEPGSDEHWMTLAGSALLLAGMAFKLSLVPFHMWTPDVYEGAPAPTTAFLGTVSKACIFAVLLRLFINVDGFSDHTLMTGLYWLAVFSILIGNILALMQTSIKRLLAYSSTAQLGYLMVAFIAASALPGRELAVEAAVMFVIAYVLTTLGAFGVVTLMSVADAEHDTDELSAYVGLFWRRPLLASFMTAMLLSLAGIPLTAGFIGKFYIFTTGVQNQLWSLLTILVVGSGIGLFYYLRVVYAMARPVDGDDGTATLNTLPITGSWALLLVTLVLIGLGVYPTPLVNWVSQMTQELLCC
ncbi:MAG: NADH-quinone oxidoreductase subunit N [Candidatus Pseudothioglobus sp.]|jgi:NADH-quinone oxidoreductase subunit N